MRETSVVARVACDRSVDRAFVQARRVLPHPASVFLPQASITTSAFPPCVTGDVFCGEVCTASLRQRGIIETESHYQFMDCIPDQIGRSRGIGLTGEERDLAGGVIRLSPARAKTLVGRILPFSLLTLRPWRAGEHTATPTARHGAHSL